jgi:hypothetical protein
MAKGMPTRGAIVGYHPGDGGAPGVALVTDVQGEKVHIAAFDLVGDHRATNLVDVWDGSGEPPTTPHVSASLEPYSKKKAPKEAPSQTLGEFVREADDN